MAMAARMKKKLSMSSWSDYSDESDYFKKKVVVDLDSDFDIKLSKRRVKKEYKPSCSDSVHHLLYA